jgi:hypothetical protein
VKTIEEFQKLVEIMPEWSEGANTPAKAWYGFAKAPKPKSADAAKSKMEGQAAEPPQGNNGAEHHAEPNGHTKWSNADHTDHTDQGDYGSGERNEGEDEAEYLYPDAAGRPYSMVKRKAKPKGFPTYWWNGTEWVKGWHPRGPIPYRLPELLKAPPDATIYITEGEKDSNNLTVLGLVATTAPGGALKWPWDAQLTKWFEGFRRFVVLEDNDPAGHQDAQIRARGLSRIPGAEVRVVGFRDMPVKSDVTDWLDQGYTKDDLLARCEAAPLFKRTLEIHSAGSAMPLPPPQMALW